MPFIWARRGGGGGGGGGEATAARRGGSRGGAAAAPRRPRAAGISDAFNDGRPSLSGGLLYRLCMAVPRRTSLSESTVLSTFLTLIQSLKS